MAWGKDWGKPDNHQYGKFNTEPKEYSEEDKAKIDAALHGAGFIQDGKHVPLNEVFVIEEVASISEQSWNNLKPTHDPYTNPDAYLYYQCDCGETLDPKTKRFAELNNCASHAGWKIRFGAHHYVPYCPKCVKEKGIE